MKSFKQMMAEVAEPKSPEEKRFKDQHVIQKFDHPAAEDSQFTGEITGKTKQKRLADQEGDANYDKAYSQRKNGTAKLESVEEEADQLDEISKKLAGRYIKRAQMDTAHAGDQIATGSMGQAGASPDVKKGYEKQRQKGISKLIRRRAGTSDAVAKLTGTARVNAKEEVELSENPMEEKPMMMNALRAMSHNMQGIAKYVQSTNDPEEWFQNKLAGVAKEMQTLYSYATAETMTGMATEETVVENKPASIIKKLAKASASSEKGKKAVTLKKAPWEKKEETELTDEELSAKQKKIDRNKNGKIDGHDLAMLRKKKNEEVALDEAVKQGNMKLRDGSSVKVSKQDAGLINQMMNDLNSVNRRKMEKVMMNDKAGFEEIVGFAREAL